MEDYQSAGQTVAGTASSTSAKVTIFEELLALLASGNDADKEFLAPYVDSMKLAEEIANSATRRVDIPIRKTFVRSLDPETVPPLARIVSRGGRGGGLAVKLYIALIWRCSAKPYSTEIPARKWARLLALEDPNHKGARRVAKALKLLEELQLIELTTRRGEPSIICLKDESGDGSEYELPSTAYTKGRADKDRYLKVSVKLWTKAYIQMLSSPALAMLLILLTEGSGDAEKGAKEGTEVWWSTERFPLRYWISPAMRSRGTKDLIAAGLLYVRRQSVANPGSKKDFVRERVRNVYRLQNSALVYAESDDEKKKK